MGEKLDFAGGFNWDDGLNTIDIYVNVSNTSSATASAFHKGALTGIAVNDSLYWTSGVKLEVKNVRIGASDISCLS
ncbi:MAG: hypothetical protein M3040_17040 [Bacteroidota bacterium]|nr:hypothetical protein [Bacteroidota bacterium]